MTPAISVIIPAYNHGRYIMETLDSVFAQTYKDFEVIVVNDGSPDNTADVLRPLVQAGKIRYIEQPNGGQALARNRGLREATGEFIAYLDDDDLWPPDKLEWQVKALRAADELKVVCGRVVSLGDDAADAPNAAAAPTGMTYEDFCAGNPICSPGQSLIRTEALREIGGFDVNIRGTDDWDVWLRLSEKGPFEYSNSLALVYRQHDNNASRNRWSMYRNLMLVVRKHFGNRWNYKNRERHRVARAWVKYAVVSVYLDDVDKCNRDGRRLEAVKNMLMAMLVDPIQVLRPVWRKIWRRLSPATKAIA